MATAAPPRRESLGNLFGQERKPKSSLDTLTSMGFPKSRAEKALAATGNKGVNLASNWLLSHAHDPTLDMLDPREYIIYLCPTGDFMKQLKKMWHDSHEECGWNSAHIYHAHITLCSFFHMPDSKEDVLDHIISLASDIVKEWPSLNYHIGLDLHTENNSFIGYFVTRDVHKLIEDMMVRIQQEFKNHGVAMEPQKKQLHMTLAFQYNPDDQGKLMRMARGLSLPKEASWEIRIYSRLPVLRNSEVRRIVKSYHPEQADELELSYDDHIYMDPEEHRKSLDGWFKGTSHNKGISGFFPGIFTQKTSQMDIWTLHRLVKLFPSPPRSPMLPRNGVDPNLINGTAIQETATAAAALSSSSATSAAVAANTSLIAEYHNPPPIFHTSDGYAVAGQQNTMRSNTPDSSPHISIEHTEDGYAKPAKLKGQKNHSPPIEKKPRKLYVVRHAQRCDFSFKSWFDRSFDKKGNYQRFDLNCPPFLWPRKSMGAYSKDCPLTEIGRAQARITGEGLRHAGDTLSFIYSSCALRCVQTAQEIANGIGASCKILIEPALFEWCGWCRSVMPDFFKPEELAQAGFNIDLSYVPLMPASQLNLAENVGSYYMRSFQATKHILMKHAEKGGNILLVGHSGSMDACTRQIRGKPAYTTEGELRDVVRGIPYCFLSCAVEETGSRLWTLCDPPVPILTHGMNKDYDWRSMLT